MAGILAKKLEECANLKPSCWLMKSEPDAYSIDDLKRDKKAEWDGVRNYQARNIMRDLMKVGDKVLYYHSNAKPPGIVGLAEVSKLAFDDPSQFDTKSKYYDPKSDPENPRWQCVEVKFKKKFKRIVTLDELKEEKALQSMLVTQRGQRLSVQPVSPEEYAHVLEMVGR